MCKRRRADPAAHKKELCAYHLFSLPAGLSLPGVRLVTCTILPVIN
jgi:hypothetical protein